MPGPLLAARTRTSGRSAVDRIHDIIRNRPLAESIGRAIRSALAHESVHLSARRTAWSVFRRSLSLAIRDIETHPRGRLFQRLVCEASLSHRSRTATARALIATALEQPGDPQAFQAGFALGAHETQERLSA